MAELTAKQQRFLEEFQLDLNASRAAARAGYAQKSEKSLGVQAVRLLGNVRIQVALAAAMKERRERLRVSTDRIVEEFCKIAFSNIRDFVPGKGESLDLRRLDADRTAAVEFFEQQEVVGKDGEIHRRLRLKLHDKIAALNALARHLGMLSTHHVVETSIEHRVRQMSVEERIARVAELRQRALHIYLPMYRARGDAEGAEQQNQLANGRPTIAWTATAVVDAANDNDECVAIGEVLQREDLDGGVATANAVEQQIELSG